MFGQILPLEIVYCNSQVFLNKFALNRKDWMTQLLTKLWGKGHPYGTDKTGNLTLLFEGLPVQDSELLSTFVSRQESQNVQTPEGE